MLFVYLIFLFLTASCYCSVQPRKLRNHLIGTLSQCSYCLSYFLKNSFDSSCWKQLNLMWKAVTLLFFSDFQLKWKCCVFCVTAPAGLVVGDPERFGGGDVPRQPDRGPLYGEQFRGVTNHGEGVHERCDEDQGGWLPGMISTFWLIQVLFCLFFLHSSVKKKKSGRSSIILCY